MKQNCYLTTVYHTGTHYFYDGLVKRYRVSMSHINKSVLNQLPNYETIYATYRNPLHIAASWANRDRFKGKKAQFDRWEEQFTLYSQLKDFNPLILDFTKGTNQHGIQFAEKPANEYQDKYGLHLAIAKNDTKQLYKHISKDLIDYALDCSEWANEKS